MNKLRVYRLFFLGIQQILKRGRNPTLHALQAVGIAVVGIAAASRTDSADDTEFGMIWPFSYTQTRKGSEVTLKVLCC